MKVWFSFPGCDGIDGNVVNFSFLLRNSHWWCFLRLGKCQLRRSSRFYFGPPSLSTLRKWHTANFILLERNVRRWYASIQLAFYWLCFCSCSTRLKSNGWVVQFMVTSANSWDLQDRGQQLTVLLTSTRFHWLKSLRTSILVWLFQVIFHGNPVFHQLLQKRTTFWAYLNALLVDVPKL